MLVYYLASSHQKLLVFIRRYIDLRSHYSSHFSLRSATVYMYMYDDWRHNQIHFTAPCGKLTKYPCMYKRKYTLFNFLCIRNEKNIINSSSTLLYFVHCYIINLTTITNCIVWNHLIIFSFIWYLSRLIWFQIIRKMV